VTSPILLTGICFCASCGGAMTLRTGTGSAGGNYRYYTCSTKARQGKTGCSGNTVPMDRLDDAVVDHLESRLLHPQRLEAMMDDLLDRRDEWVERRRDHIGELRKRASEAEARLKSLYDAIENGVVDASDPSLKDRVAELVAIRDQARSDTERAVAAVERIGPIITAESLRTFTLVARRKLRNEDGTYRRDYLRAVAQRVEVVNKNEVRVMGSRSELLRTLTAASGVEAAVTGVRGFAPKWCTRLDSNQWPLPSEGSALSS
jgi:site-specific DNA recombinase